MAPPDDDIAHRARARVGTVLGGKYRVDRLLGVGGAASVFVATHLRNANCVAVKILHRSLNSNDEMRKRFLREGYAANSVGHSGTVRVLDDDVTDDGAPFLVMELLDGETLDARCARNGGRLGVGEVVKLICDLLDVLEAAHKKRIIHRDIKPENLFFTCDSELKVLDFGIARLHQSGAPTATGHGIVFGTPAFMPPEQALGYSEKIDALSDIWAVGATAFCLLSGRCVHEGTTSAEVVARAATRPAPPLSSVTPWVPASIADVIDRALAFDREDRWPSAKAMRRAFDQARDGGGTQRTKSEAEDLTKINPPPAMTPAASHLSDGQAIGALDAPTNPIASTVAGVVSNKEARRRRNWHRIAVGSAVGGFAAVILVAGAVTAFKGSPAPRASSLTAQSRAEPESSMSLIAVPLPTPPPLPTAESTRPVIVDALPEVTAGPAASARPRVPPAPAARPRPAVPPPAAISPSPARPPKRDPLAPW